MTLPHSTEAEMSVLCALMGDPEAIHDVRGILEPGDFHVPSHETLYRTICQISDAGGVPDPVEILARLGDRRGDVGGGGYVAEIMDAVPSYANAKGHARIVRDRSTLRTVIRHCSEVVELARLPDAKAVEVMRAAEEKLLGVSERRKSRDYEAAGESVMRAFQLIEEAARSEDGITGLRTGFSWLDYMLGGLRDGDLTILAARPAMGKTAFGLQAARNVSGTGAGVAVASYEMSEARLMHRRLAAEANVDSHRLRMADLTRDEYARLADAGRKLSGLPIHIQYPPPRTVEGLRSDLIRLSRRTDIRLFVVDYLQQMSGPGSNRNSQVEHISRGLKGIASDLGIHVLALSQLSRAVESRSPPRPQLSDLRDSGAIEQDADNVLQLWRPEEYFDERTSPEHEEKWRDKAEVLLQKQRDGQTGRSVMAWHRKTTTFSEIDTRAGDMARTHTPDWIHQ